MSNDEESYSEPEEMSSSSGEEERKPVKAVDDGLQIKKIRRPKGSSAIANRRPKAIPSTSKKDSVEKTVGKPGAVVKRGRPPKKVENKEYVMHTLRDFLDEKKLKPNQVGFVLFGHL